MLLDGKHEIQIFCRSVKEIVEDICEIHRTPVSLRLRKASLLVSAEEEAALDALFGMMWVFALLDALKINYHKKGMDLGNIGIDITFPDPHVKLTFRKA